MAETDENSFSPSAKKIIMQEIFVTRDSSVEYRILNFITVFAAISKYEKLKPAVFENHSKNRSVRLKNC